MGRYPKALKKELPSAEEVIESVEKEVDSLFDKYNKINVTEKDKPQVTIDTPKNYNPDNFTGTIPANIKTEIKIYCSVEKCGMRDTYTQAASMIWGCLKCPHLKLEFV